LAIGQRQGKVTMAINILVCVKRVPATGSKITLTADAQAIDTHYLGFTISPHEECAVEEAVRLVEAHGGSSTVLTLGPAAAEEQLRDAMALGMDKAVLLEAGQDEREWDPQATAAAIVDAIQGMDPRFDLILMGNEAADTGDYQVAVRVAHALGWPCVTGIKGLALEGGTALATREAPGGRETLAVDLPAVLSVKEGLNLPRYPSLPGRLKAKKKPLARLQPQRREAALEMVRLKLPSEAAHQVVVLGEGPQAAAGALEVFKRLGVV
jgi:electron transfer flavoprotein beta subunit